MSHISNLDSVKPDSDALELLTSSYARVNLVLPLSIRDDGLHVVVPDNDSYDSTVVRDQLEYVLEMPVVIHTGNRMALDQLVAEYFPATSAFVENCPPEFQSQCPKHWDQLARTDNSNERHCNTCDQLVYLCSSDADVSHHATQGHCIAVVRRDVDLLGIIDPT